MSDAHEAGIARFLKPSRAARWRAARHDPDDLYHFAARFDPAWVEELRARTPGEVTARVQDEGGGETCVAFLAHGADWGEPAAVGEAIPDLLYDGAGILSFVAGRLALYVGEDGSPVLLLRR